jgi:hypothetical protein
MFCPDCGAENSRSQKFCTRCGTNLIAIDRAREIVSEMRANASAPPVSPEGILKIVALISAIGFIATAAGTVALKHTGLTQSFFALVGFTALVMICRYLLQLIVSLRLASAIFLNKFTLANPRLTEVNGSKWFTSTKGYQ